MAYAATFDTHKFVKTLESKGFNTEQAEGLNEVLNEAIEQSNVVTFRLVASREDVEKVRADVEKVRTDVDKVRADVENVRADVENVRADVGNVRADVEKVRIDVEKVRADVVNVRIDVEKVRTEMEKWRASNHEDVEALRASTREEFGKVRLEMVNMRSDLASRIDSSKNDMLKWYFGGIVFQILAVFYLLAKFTGNG
jgi:chromosome segregation ATPase